MKIKAKANGNIIEAHDDAAKELIAAGIYEPVEDKEEKRSPVAPMGTETFPAPPKAKAPKGRKAK